MSAIYIMSIKLRLFFRNITSIIYHVFIIVQDKLSNSTWKQIININDRLWILDKYVQMKKLSTKDKEYERFLLIRRDNKLTLTENQPLPCLLVWRKEMYTYVFMWTWQNFIQANNKCKFIVFDHCPVNIWTVFVDIAFLFDCRVHYFKDIIHKFYKLVINIGLWNVDMWYERN